ncbi:MAG: sensor histidine kinase [Candidatus Tectomicrobia bacterium]|uniref:Sensor histidine kinase n=1 Tax=Tectimicrobiota bacterium TaxID=2528274 RepID=A0A932CLT6_UNCTE|nr:sensor histidine kinase [Candidatus Tectomicrobia bacterium]
MGLTVRPYAQTAIVLGAHPTVADDGITVEDLVRIYQGTKSREIHHRVKNNLQIVSSLLSLQSRSIQDKQAREIFQESQNRVKSMALVHEKLYQSQELSRIDFAKYIETLATNLFRSYGANSDRIHLKIDADHLLLDADVAIPCGLIINELVSNSLKHAFPAGKGGEIRIALCSKSDDELALGVKDNGVGFPKDLDFRNTKSLGLRLVGILTDQVGGAVELCRDDGTEFKISILKVKHGERR